MAGGEGFGAEWFGVWRRADKGGVEEVGGCVEEGVQEGPDGTVLGGVVHDRIGLWDVGGGRV